MATATKERPPETLTDAMAIAVAPYVHEAVEASVDNALHEMLSELRALRECLGSQHIPPTLSLREAAEILGVSIRTIQDYIGDGRLKATRRLGTKRIRREWLIEAMENQRCDGCIEIDL